MHVYSQCSRCRCRFLKIPYDWPAAVFERVLIAVFYLQL